MLPPTKLFSASLLTSWAYAAPLNSRAAVKNTNLVQDLISAATAVDRIKDLLADDPDNFVFDFAANTNKTGAGK